MKRSVQEFFDPSTFTLSYIVYDKESKDAVILDPVWDYKSANSVLDKKSLNRLTNFLQKNELRLRYILETHAHADHISGAAILKDEYPDAKIAIGRGILSIQKVFKKIFNLSWLKINGSQFDILLDDQQILNAGSFDVNIIATPGHTPACCSFLIDDIVFTGDTLFMPDFGTGRCDFPEGSSSDLYDSIFNKLYKLPANTVYYTGHDYLPNGRELLFCSTIKESKNHNIQLRTTTSKNEFIEFRDKRDVGLPPPKILLPSIQININGGRLPCAEENGISYLKIPLEWN